MGGGGGWVPIDGWQEKQKQFVQDNWEEFLDIVPSWQKIELNLSCNSAISLSLAP